MGTFYYFYILKNIFNPNDLIISKKDFPLSKYSNDNNNNSENLKKIIGQNENFSRVYPKFISNLDLYKDKKNKILKPFQKIKS